MKIPLIVVFYLLYAGNLSAKPVNSFDSFEGTGCFTSNNDFESVTPPVGSKKKREHLLEDSTKVKAIGIPKKTKQRNNIFRSLEDDSLKMMPSGSSSTTKELGELDIKNNLAKNILGYFLTSQTTEISHSGVQSILYFKPFAGKKIASIHFVRLHPFGASMQDTSLVASKWIEKTGNRLHMNTARTKLRMQLQFREGESVDPLLMAENEKFMRDLSYLEDVSFRLEPSKERPDEVNVTVISKDKFEFGASMSVDADNSNVEIVNENMFGLGHRLNIGMAQKNAYLPEMGIYLSYQINNIFGHFINSTIGFTDTYQKKGWNIAVEKKFLTSKEENVGGLSFDHVAKYNYIADNHPIQLDTIVSYIAGDIWYSHAFPGKRNISNKTLISMRYFHQEFNRNKDQSFGESKFLRNHDFVVAGISFTRRNLYKNNLVYGYGVTEDIPYGNFIEINTGLDRSQFGNWPYLGLSLSSALIGKDGSYLSGQLGMDGFLDKSSVRQGTVKFSGNYFSGKFYALGDPIRQFMKIEFLGGINRLKEEYLTIDGRFGIRDFHTSQLKGICRLKFNIETVRYLKSSFYGFKFTNYLFTDFAFLSDQVDKIFSQDFYAGFGSGFRIYNPSLVFKIIDIRLTWFPVLPPEGMSRFGFNLQGVTKSRFDDFLGRKPELIRFQ